jgi:competence protein ComEA
VGVALLVALVLATSASWAASPSEQAGAREQVDLNSASADSLTTVPGIGPVMAERIVAWREAHGPFRRVEDLMKVKGVGEKTLDKLRPYVKVGKSR